MLKNKEFWIGFLIAVIVFVGLTELQKSNNRATALSDVKNNISKIKRAEGKAALVIRSEAIINANKSWFSFYNSSANEVNPEDQAVNNPCNGNAVDWTCNLRNDRGDIFGIGPSTQQFDDTVNFDENGDPYIGHHDKPCSYDPAGC